MSKLINEGYYNAVAKHVPDAEGNDDMVRWDEVGKDKTKKVVVYFEILDGPNAGEVYAWSGFFSKKSAKRTVESLKYCGFKGDDLTDLNNQLLNQKVQVEIAHNSYEKEDDDGSTRTVTYAEVSWVNQLGRGALKLQNPMSDDAIRKFAAMMRNSVRGVNDVEGETHGDPSTREPAPAEAAYDDDVPF